MSGGFEEELGALVEHFKNVQAYSSIQIDQSECPEDIDCKREVECLPVQQRAAASSLFKIPNVIG